MYHVKEDRRQINSAKNIVTGLFEILEKKKLEDITISEVSEYVKVGRATFYRSFDNLNDVLYYAVDLHMNEFKKALIKYRKQHHRTSGVDYLEPTLEYWQDKEWLIRTLVKINLRSLLIKGLMEIDKELFVDTFDERYRAFSLDVRCSVWISIIISYVLDNKNLSIAEIRYIVEHQFNSMMIGM